MTRSIFKSTATLLTAAAAPLALATALHADSTGSATKVYPDAEVNTTEDALSATKAVDVAIDENADVAPVQADALMAAVGTELLSSDGVTLGTITDITVDAQGDAELVVDVSDIGLLEGDELTLSMGSDDIRMAYNKIVLQVSEAELATKAKDAPKGKINI